MMQTAETRTVEVVNTQLNGESLNGMIFGSGLVVAAASIAMLTGGMEIKFPDGPTGLLPMIGILVGLAVLFYFFLNAQILSVTRETKEMRIPTPRSKAPLDARIEDTASEQTTTRGDGTKPVAAQPSAPSRDRERDRTGGKGRTDGSSKAPHDEKPGDGRPDEKKVLKDA